MKGFQGAMYDSFQFKGSKLMSVAEHPKQSMALKLSWKNQPHPQQSGNYRLTPCNPAARLLLWLLKTKSSTLKMED